MEIRDFIDEVARVAREKGWWPNGERNFGEAIALMHSELSEALEEWRDGKPLFYYECPSCDKPFDGNCEACGYSGPTNHLKPEGVLVEFSDVFIRIGDLIGNMKGSSSTGFEEALKEKMVYNLTRPHRHGNKRA